MYTFLPTEQTAGLVFFNLCLLLLMYALMRNSLKSPHIIVTSNKRVTVVLMFIFVLFSFWGADWFHYLEAFNTLKRGGQSNIEEIYFWIAQYLSPNYIVFRLLVWGTSLCLLLHTFKRLSIPTHLAIFFFSTIYIIWFSYARVTLAMVLIYYGLTVLYKSYKSKLNSIVLGITAIAGSFFFHKSALFGIAAAFLTLFVKKFDRKTILIILFCYPILLYLTQNFLHDFLIADMNGEEGGFGANMAVGQNYLNADSRESGWGSIIQRFFERFPHFLLAYISIQFIRSKFYYKAPKDIQAFIRLQFFIVLLSSLFMFDLGVNTSTVYSRFLRFAVIPSCIILTYFYSKRFNFKYTKIAFYIAFIGTIYAVTYSMYNAFYRVNSDVKFVPPSKEIAPWWTNTSTFPYEVLPKKSQTSVFSNKDVYK